MATTFPIRASLTANATSCRAKRKPSTKLAPLSKRQMRFAEKNHKLVYAFLQERRYDIPTNTMISPLWATCEP